MKKQDINKNIVLDRLSHFFRDYSQKYRLKKMGLFGSVARDEANELSDIDVVVEFEKPNLFLQAELMLRLKELFDRDVDVISVWKHMNPRLKSRIDKEVIYV